MSNLEGNTHRACVLTQTHAHYGNGTIVTLPRPLDLVSILTGTVGRFARHCTIIVDGTTCDELGARAPAARVLGWNYSKVGPWTLYHREDGRTVALGCRDSMGPRHFGVLVEPDTDPGVLAMRLDRYHRATGLSWRGTCATTALNAIRLTWENVQYEPRWNLPKIAAGRAVGPLIWKRDLSPVERHWGWVHTFDATSAYLGAAINADLAWSVLEHTGPKPFDRAPGYWHIRLGAATLALDAQPGRPPLLPAGRVRDGCVWLTAPYVHFLGELGDPLDVIDSWTGVQGRRPAGFRVLRKFGEQIRDARARADHPWLDYAIKRTYKDATGGMQRAGMRVYRPDWAHTLIDLWRATLYRRLIRVHQTQGVWPVRIITDSVSYADCVEQPLKAGSTAPWETLNDALSVRSCAIGCGCAPGRASGLGTYKHESTMTADEWVKVMCK